LLDVLGRSNQLLAFFHEVAGAEHQKCVGRVGHVVPLREETPVGGSSPTGIRLRSWEKLEATGKAGTPRATPIDTAVGRLVWSEGGHHPGPDLEKIRTPLLAINSADDLINPPELGILQRQIKRVKSGRAVVLPISPETIGHGTHTKAAVWKQHLDALLKRTES
jgi:hypothetical protein